MRAETRVILNNTFSENDKKEFKKFSKIIQNKYMDKNAQREIWEYDQKIGGFGGYVAPFKHFNSKERVELPQVIIYSKEDLGKIIIIKYNNNLMRSVEK